MSKSTTNVPRARGDKQQPIGAYLLRDIPPELWRSAKIAAAERGVKLRDLLIAGLQKEIGIK